MDEAPITWLLVNPASGSNDAAAVADVRQALEEVGRAPRRIVEAPGEPLPDRGELDAAGVGLLVLFTGDGTANGVVTSLHGWTGEVLVLPGGTQNLLAKSLHGEAAAPEIVARFGSAGLRRVRRPLVRCSAGEALVEIVAGPGAAWSGVRESLRERDVAEIAAAMREAIEKSAAGPMVRAAQPPLGKPAGYPAIRIYPDGDHGLAVDGYGAESVLDYAKHGLALLQRDFREGPHDELGRHPALICRSEAPIELMIDGERSTGGYEEKFELIQCDVTFLASGAQDA